MNLLMSLKNPLVKEKKYLIKFLILIYTKICVSFLSYQEIYIKKKEMIFQLK